MTRRPVVEIEAVAYKPDAGSQPPAVRAVPLPQAVPLP
jgi:hypothetical protein